MDPPPPPSSPHPYHGPLPAMLTPVTAAPPPPLPQKPAPRYLTSGVIHASADSILALIESEVYEHTAAAAREIAALRAALEAARADNRRMAGLLASLGVGCGISADAHAEETKEMGGGDARFHEVAAAEGSNS